MSEPRATCPRCRRPTSVCWCAHVPTLPTKTRVVLLQHPRERRQAIGTARMAHLSLPGSQLHTGIVFDGDRAVNAALDAHPGDTYVLFPGPTAIDVGALPDRPITLVVVDGTWSQAKKLLTANPRLAALPRVGLAPTKPSEYRIRKQPAELFVSTIEALAEVLAVLEGRSFEALREPFRKMVDRQIHFEEQVNASRHRLHVPKARIPSLPKRLREADDRLVCVYGESNGWPRHVPQRTQPELVHWVAYRPTTGERYEAIIAPRVPLAPATCEHIGIDEATLRAGVRVDEWTRSFQAFCRPDDLLVHWGAFYMTLARREGLPLPAHVLDLRGQVTQVQPKHARRSFSIGSIDACSRQIGSTPAPLGVRGRGGHRLSLLVGMVATIERLTSAIDLPPSA